MSRDGYAGMDVESGGRASGQLGDGGLAVAAGGSLTKGRALGDPACPAEGDLGCRKLRRGPSVR